MIEANPPIISSGAPYFLQGGGHMGALIRAKDWGSTPLGEPTTWPQSLRTMVSVMLDNPFGMYIAWGKAYTQIYNDGYRPILGSTKHPAALGISTSETFKEIWHIIGSMFEGVMNGQAVGFPDFMLPLNRNGFEEDCYFDFSYSPIRKEDGEVGGVLVTVLETTNKKLAEVGLKESKQQLEFAIEAAELATWDYNPVTNKFTSNDRLKEWFGLKDENETDLQHAINSIAVKDQDRVAREIQQSLQFTAGGKYDIEFSVVHPETLEERIVRTKGKAWFDDTNTCYRLNGTVQDITTQATARIKLERNEEQLRIALEGGEMGTFDYFPADGMVLWSEKTKELFGLPQDAGVNLDLYLQALHPDDRNTSQAVARQKVNKQNGGLYELEYRTIGLTDGKQRWLRSKGLVTYDSQNNPIRYTGIIQDITQRKEAEQAQKESEERFRTIADNISQLSWITDEKGKMIWFNKRWLEYTGTTLEQMLEEGAESLHHPEHWGRVMDKYLRAVNDGKEWEDTFPLLGADGQYRWFLSRAIPIKNAEGKVMQWFGTNTDITGRMQAEEALRESEERFRTLADNISQLTWMANAEGNIFWYNKKWYEYTGTTLDQMQGWGWQSVHDPQRLPDVLVKWRICIENGQPFEMVFPIKNADGKFRQFLTRVLPVMNSDGEIYQWFGTNTDITQQLEAEEALKESEERFRSLANDMAAFVFTGDADTNVEFVNKQWLDFVGLTSEEAVGKAWSNLTHPDDVAPMIAVYRDAVERKKPYEFETRQQNHSGVYSWVLWKGMPRLNKEGTFCGMIGVGIDITDRKNAEAALRIQQAETQKLQRLYEAVTGNTPDLVYIFDLNYRFTYANPALLAMWGKTWDEAIGKSLLENGYAPWHAAMHEREIDEMVISKKSIRGTVSFPHAELGQRVYDYIFAPVLNDVGNVEAIAGITRDITEISRAEDELLKSEQHSRTMVETAPFPIGVYIGKEMMIQFANQSILDIWGKGNDVIGKSFKQVLPELDNQEVFKQLDAVYTTGIPYHAKNQEINIVTAGETTSFYFNYSFTPLADAEGKFYGVMNTAADVTDLNLAKLAIQKSEENLRNTILQAPVAMCIFKGKHFVVDLANQRMFELWGKNAKQVLHKPIFEGLPEAKDQGFEAILHGVFTTGKTFSADGVPVTLPRNGSVELVYVNFVYEPYREADGIITGILAVAIDVTTQITATKKIEEREQKFRLLADSMPQLIWTGDAAGNLDYFNQSVYDFSGLAEEKVITARGWLEIVHPDEREENIRRWNNSISTGTDFKFEHRFRRHDGEYRWQLSRAVPQKDAEGNIRMWVGTSTDIQEIKEMDQQKDDFISIASHEMKTPLTSAKGYLELLQMVLSEENTNTFLYASKAHQALERLNSLITELLDASKIKNGQLQYNVSTFNFNQMLEETIENMQHTTKTHHIQKTGMTMQAVTGDKDRLQQVVINLLSNAIKYSPHADKVSLTVEEKPGEIQVSVKDFGIGMSGQHIDKIFNRYYRVQEHAIHFQGLGIGLYLSSNIIQRHAGKMWADSEPGKGSTFYFTLPL